MADVAKKKHAWLRITEQNLPEIKTMEIGGRYQITATVEPTELSTGEDEYGELYSSMPGGKKPPKPPMSARFKIHSMSLTEGSGSKKSTKPEGRYAEK